MRPKRKKLKFNEESVNDLLQEIYNDSHNLKAKITRLFTKWETKIKESGEVAAIGDQIVKLISAESKNQDQKIMLLKYLKEVVFNNKGGDGGNSSNVKTVSETSDNEEDITTSRRNELLMMVQKELEKKQKIN